MKNRVIAATMIAGATFLTACGSQAGSSAQATESAAAATEVATVAATENAAEDTAFPITVEHALGETVIESAPQNVAAIGWGNLDVPLALGIAPTGVSKPTFGATDENGLFSWTNEAFASLGVDAPNVFDDTDGLDFEAINNSEPDVILGVYSGISAEEYEQLSEIAPTVAYPTEAWAITWQEMTRKNAEALGKSVEGEQLVTDLEAMIAEKSAEHPELEGLTAAYVYFDTTDLGSFYVYMPKDPRASYLLDLGLTLPEEIRALDDGSFFFMTVSSENVDVLNDLDILVAWGEDDTLATLQADQLMGQIPAVKNGSVVMLSNSSALISASCTPPPLTIPATNDEYLDLISEAAAKVSK